MKDQNVTDPDDILQRLQQESTDSPLWLRFISRMTIGESYLFRDPNHMSLLQQTILPHLLSEAKQRPVSIWSAGCSHGEEPYTISILLHELDADIQRLPIQIIATDIDAEAIEHARKASYGTWAFRQTPYFIQRKYFNKQGNQYTLHSSVTKMVQFARHHLSVEQTPAIFPNTKFDLILCRNVIMYLREDFRERAGRTLGRWLAGSGLLITGQVERITGVEDLIEDHFVHNVSFYTHRHRPSSHSPLESLIREASLGTKHPPVSWPNNAVKEAPTPKEVSRSAKTTALVLQSTSEKTAQLLRNSLKSTPPPAPDLPAPAKTNPEERLDALASSELYDTVRSLIYSKKINEAILYCQTILAANPLEAENHCLLALVYLEASQPDNAIEALRRAVYCDPNNLTAFYLWWLIGVRHHRHHWERMPWIKRHLSRLVAELPDSHPVPLVAKVTAGDIRYLLQHPWNSSD